MKTLNLLFLIVVIALVTTSCSKEDNQVEPEASNELLLEDADAVPFFYVAKGESISKSILRNKPNTDGENEITVLFSSEDNLKAVDNSSGSGYISGLKASIRKGNNAPATMSGYKKISVDLNEGAGGKWIYLYYKKSSINYNSLCYLNVRSSRWPIWNTSRPFLYKQATNFANGQWSDLNNGAGGYNIKIEGCTSDNIGGYLLECAQNGTSPGWFPTNQDPIKDILIISSNKSMSSYSGWTLIKSDLNKGAGGKYIYLCYKK